MSAGAADTGSVLTQLRAAFRGSSGRAFGVCLLAIMLSSADQSLFSFAIPAITTEFGIGLEPIGQMLSLSFAVASFTVVVAGVTADSLGRKTVLLVLLGLSALLVGAHALVPSLGALTVVRVASFAVGAGVFPIANTIVVESAPQRFRGLMAGWLQIGYPLGFALASLAAAPLIVDYGWRSVFVPALIVVVMLPLLFRWLPETERFASLRGAHDTLPGTFGSRLRRLAAPPYRRRAAVCFLGSFMISLAIGGTTYFLPTYLVQGMNVPQDQASLIVGGSYLIGAVGYLLVSYLGEFVTTRRNALLIWLGLGTVVFALTIWLARSPLALLGGLGLSILFFYGSEAIRMPLIGELFPTDIRATATALTGSLAVTLAWLIAPILITYNVSSLGWALTFSYFAVIPLAVGTSVFLLLENLSSGLTVEQTSGAQSASGQ